VLQTSIDGIPVFHDDRPGPLAAGLVFGVGRADEAFVRGGLTHLVEHLVMGALGRQTIECNASVDLTTTEFTAQGTPVQVAAFLRSVCRALADLPTDRLAVEVDVLRTEGSSTAAPGSGVLLGEVYGVGGLGLAAVREPALRSLTAGDVRGWTRTHFTRRNAALWLSGSGADGLTLPLADGPRPARTPVIRRDLPTPAWGVMAIDGRVAIGAELPDGPALSATVSVLRERVEEELRHRRGIAYAVEADQLVVDADNRFLVVTTDVRAGQEDVAATLLWREVRRLADDGPEHGDLQHERAVLAAFLADPRSAQGEVRARARAHVTGAPSRTAAQMRADAAGLTVEAVRASARAFADRALLAVPQPVRSPLPGLTRLPEWSTDVVSGRVFPRRRSSGAPKGARLVVGADGVSVVLDDAERITVRWRDVVGLVRTAPGEWLLFGADGFSLPLSAEDWREGAEAVETVRAAVPLDLQVTGDDALDEDDEGILVVRAPAYRVREAVGMSAYDATIVYNSEWTAVLPDRAVPLSVRLGEITAVLGRRSVALVLRRAHADLQYVLFRGGTELDRHRWGIAPGDPALLAEATGRPGHHVTYLHGVAGTPEETAGHVVQALGLPPEVRALLAGAPVGGEHVPGRGALGGFRASVGGAYDPPPGTTGLIHRWERVSRARPAWFRVLNAAAAMLCALGLWLLLAEPNDLHGRLFLTVTGLAILGLLTSSWNVRPPAREEPAAERPYAEVSPSG
jgi:hypothetical protein